MTRSVLQGRPSRFLIALLVASTALGSSGTANAQWMEGSEPNRWRISLGGQSFKDFVTRLRVDSQTGRGTELELERGFDLEREATVFRFDGSYRFSSRHAIHFSQYEVDRAGEQQLTRDIRFRNQTFVATSDVTKNFDMSISKISYGYNFMVRDRGVMGFTAGLEVIDIYSRLRTREGLIDANASGTAPLPVLGLRGHYRFADRWRLFGSYEIFEIDVGEYSGSFGDFIVAAEYAMTPRFGAGFGLNNADLRLRAHDDSFEGLFQIRFDALLIYFTGVFGVR